MLKRKKFKLIALLIPAILIILCGGYLFAIQGEKISKDELHWAIDVPIAHRGLHGGLENGDIPIPENSLTSFQHAINFGYSIEIDIQMTLDKKLVVFHDGNLERLTGDKRDVKDVTYEEIKSLKLNGTEEHIPTLEEVLELVNGEVPLIIEIKNGKDAKELAKRTNEIMKNYNGKYAIQSFDPFILEFFKKENPETIRIQLSCNFEGEQNAHLKWYEKFLLKNLLLNFKSKPHIIAYDLNAIDNLSVKILKKNYPIISWTIKNQEDLKLGYEKSNNVIFDNIIP